MTEWRAVRLADVCSAVDYGYTASSSVEAVGPRFLRITDIVGPSLDWVDVPYCEIDDQAFEKFRLVEGDIVVARTGATVGYGRWVSPPEPSVFASYLVRFRPSDDVNARFIGHVVESSTYKEFVKRSAGGAAQPNANAKVLGSFPFRLPDRASQDRIVSLVQPIDDLIENNRRRIVLLEQMTQAIYREWFVYFRYPGRGDDDFVDSAIGPIPRGWTVREMLEVCEVVDCLHSKKPAEDANGPGVLLQLANISANGRLDLSKRFLISENDYREWTSRIEVREGDCVVTNVGRVGAVAQIPSGVTAAIGRNMTAVRPRAGLMTPTYLLEYLLSPHMQRELATKTDVGTIMDALNVKNIVRLAVPVPPDDLLRTFELRARPMRRLIEVLMLQATILRQLRDALLPRLVTGAIDVSVLDLDGLLEESAA